MKRYAMTAGLMLVAAAAGAVVAGKIYMSNGVPLRAVAGESVITCSVGGVTQFSDTVQAGYTLTGNLSYSGTLTKQ